jgi:hypothetical protein
MTSVKMIVESNQSFNKNAPITKEDGSVERLKESLTRLTLRGTDEQNNTANFVVPYTEGKGYEIGKEVTLTID